MIWIRGTVIVVQMATYAGIWCIVIISVMTGGTVVGHGGMRPVQCIISIVAGKGSRIPFRFGRMAGSTIGGKAQCIVIGIGGLIKIGCMTGGAICWCP